MIHWVILRRTGASLAFTAMVTVILSAQTTRSDSVEGPSAFLNSLSKYAQGAEASRGDLSYSTELIRMMALHVSEPNAAQLARRITLADRTARQDVRKYIPESAVAEAFNMLMAQVQGNRASPLRTDAETVHRIRGVLDANSPALTSVKEHPMSCRPNEAILLMLLLKFNNGSVVFVPRGHPAPAKITSMRAEDPADSAGVSLNKYFETHSNTTNMALFSKVLQSMGI